MISIGLRRANSVTPSQTAAVVPNIAFQYFPIGNSDEIAIVIAAMLIGPAETVLIDPSGRNSHGMIHGLSLRFSQNRFVPGATRMAKNHPNMMHCPKGALARNVVRPKNVRCSVH